MKRLLLLNLFIVAVTFSFSVDSAELYPYASVGVGYKIHEPTYVEYNGEKLDVNFGGEDTALMEAGFEYGRHVSFGLKHDSQWSTGWPFNDTNEYHKTEIFIRYKIGGR